MTDCCGGKEANLDPSDPCAPPPSPCCAGAGAGSADSDCPLTYFGGMIGHCLAYAQTAKAEGRPIVGIMCEYTPRELIMAAGGVPVCLCGGDAAMIAPAEEHMPANLCPLIKSTYGYLVEKYNPFLEMTDLIVAETTCDGKKKMYELMGEQRKMHVLELPQKENDPDARRHWLAELHKFKTALETQFGVEITDDKIRDAIAVMNRERGLRRDLAGLMRADAPPITGRQLINLKSSISGLDADLAQYRKALDLYDGKTGCPGTADKVRVLMTGVPMAHGAERVLDIIEDHGGLVVCMENCTGVKPVLEDVDANATDPIEAIADKYLHVPCSVMTKNEARLESLRTLASEYRAECIIELVWQACLTYDVESFRVKRLAETELGIPYLRIETDYAPSDSPRIAVRVEALYETIRSSSPDALACP